jgi:hypothetical protein
MKTEIGANYPSPFGGLDEDGIAEVLDSEFGQRCQGFSEAWRALRVRKRDHDGLACGHIVLRVRLRTKRSSGIVSP